MLTGEWIHNRAKSQYVDNRTIKKAFEIIKADKDTKRLSRLISFLSGFYDVDIFEKVKEERLLELYTRKAKERTKKDDFIF